MSAFKVNVVARNPKREELSTQPLPALVDTGSELTWLPADVLTSVGITPRRKRMFAAKIKKTGTQQKIEREVGYAILSAEGYETNDEVVFAEPGDLTLLGVRTLEGFGVMVDNIAHRFVATTTLVARINGCRLGGGEFTQESGRFGDFAGLHGRFVNLHRLQAGFDEAM